MMRNKVLREDDIQKLHTTAPEQLTDQELLLSTISAADLARKHSGGWDKEHPKCLFCGKAYRFRTFTAQCHMTSQVTGSGKHKREAAVCSMESTKDDSPLKSRFFAVRKEVYKRFKDKQQTEQQAASAALKRSMSERERDSEVIDVDNDITAPGASKQTNRTVTDRFIKKPSHEDFVAAWSEAVLGKGLTFDFFSDPLARKAILVTAQCADSIITSSSTHGKDTVLPRRKTWTAKNLPATDDRLQQEAMRVLIPLYKEIGACFMGDGWQSTSNRPILNILAASDGFINVRRAFDASGQDKNMPFIANSMVAEMRTLGQENVFSCTMDGACKGAFPIIQAQLPWVQRFVCPSHAIDGFIKNALSDTGTIRIQANAMSHVEFATIPWGETMFKNTYETAWQVVLALVSHQKPLAIFRKIANQPEFSQVGATEPLKYADTRFGSKVIMGRRLLCTKNIYRNLFVNTEMESWVERQKPQTQDKFRKVSAVVLSDTNFWKNLDMCSRIFEPALQALRVSDGMKGGTPAVLYDLCLGLDKLYSEPTDGLPEPTRRKLHDLFIARWNAFHAPVHSACFIMDKAFCRMQHDDAARKDLFQVMEAFSKVKDADGKMVGPAFKTMKSEFVAWQEAISAKKYDLHDEPEGAFTQRNMNRSQQSWVKTFMQDVMDEKGQVLFDNLAWFAKKLCSVMTSASACEHMWSIAGWIHNKRRNRLAQPNVEKAVRAHGNLVLRKAMLLSREQKVAWDSQTPISEPDRHTNEQGVDDADDDDIDC